jgi:hypothetical protein
MNDGVPVTTGVGDAFEAYRAGVASLWHRIRHPLVTGYTLVFSADTPYTDAAKILKAANIESWAAAHREGYPMLTVDKRRAKRACSILDKAGIGVLNPYPPVPELASPRQMARRGLLKE